MLHAQNSVNGDARQGARLQVAVLHGDCLKIMGNLPNRSVDMILTDLPYGTTYAPWDCRIPLRDLWRAWLRVCRPKAAIALTGSQPFTSQLVMSRPELFRCAWVWDKQNGANFANARKQPLKTHEDVLIFATGQPTYNPQMTQGAPNHTRGLNAKRHKSELMNIATLSCNGLLDGVKFPKSIQTFPKHASQSTHHRTQKPIPLFEYLIRTYSNEGDVVLDCCAGSGTTGVAALNCGRQAILIDSDEKMISIMRERIARGT